MLGVKVMSNWPATKARIDVDRFGMMREFDGVEIGPALLPVVGVLRQLDALVLLELDELEGPGADRLGRIWGGADMAGIDRRVGAGEQGQQRGLRPLEMEGDLAVAVDRHLLEN